MRTGTARTLPELYGHLFAFARRVSPSQAIIVSTYDEAPELRTCVYGASLDGATLLQHDVSELPALGLSDSPGSRAIVSGRPLVTKAYENEDMVDIGEDVHNVIGSVLAVPMRVFGRPIGVFELQAYEPDQFAEDQVTALSLAANLAAVATRNVQLIEQQAQAYETTIEGWARALDLKDHETEGHSRRVTDLTVELARRLGVPEEEIVHVRRGALLHDIGKMGVPDAILLKPGALTDDEMAVIRSHTTHARDLLAPIPFLREALSIPVHHHERWDGSGYPDGLAGTDIPRSARIFAVVDVYDALTSDRPYRAAWTPERALRHVRDGAGSHFDPEVVRAFGALIQGRGAQR